MNFEHIAMDIITSSSEAKYYCFEAIRHYKSKKYDQVKESLAKAGDLLALASHKHLKILQNEVNTDKRDYSLLLIHAEDLLINTTTLKELLTELLLDI